MSEQEKTTESVPHLVDHDEGGKPHDVKPDFVSDAVASPHTNGHAEHHTDEHSTAEGEQPHTEMVAPPHPEVAAPAEIVAAPESRVADQSHTVEDVGGAVPPGQKVVEDTAEHDIVDVDDDLEDVGGQEAEVADGETAAEEPEAHEEHHKHWYVVKVQSGREDTIKEAIERRVRKEGLEESFGQIVIPVEKVTEVKVDKNGKRVPKTKERKLYPGYLMVEVEYNDRIVYLFRETSGVGDFVGAHPGDLTKAPTPMSDREVLRMLGPVNQPTPGAASPVAPPPKWLQEGDRVRVVDGTFNGMDGSVKQILEAVSKVQVELSIFGRPVAVDFEYYQVEQV